MWVLSQKTDVRKPSLDNENIRDTRRSEAKSVKWIVSYYRASK